MADPDLDALINDLEKRVNKEPKWDPNKHKAQTRSQIASAVVSWYFWLIAIVVVGIPIYNLVAYHFYPQATDLVLSLKDTLAIVSGILNGTFGFVVGYYFKGSEKE